MRLAEKEFEVIAAVEIWAQVQTLKRQAAERGVSVQVEKLDVTDAGDRKKALKWDVEILVNNAGVGEGGSTLDIPAGNIRRQFEVNVIGPLLLTQGSPSRWSREVRVASCGCRPGRDSTSILLPGSTPPPSMLSKPSPRPWSTSCRNSTSRWRP
jgi:short-subunit dehydrogenase